MSDGSEPSLVNKGLAEINPARFDGEATLVVVGLARSGTSMLSALLQELGIYMGDAVDKAVFEDVEVARLIDAADFDGLGEFAAVRNASHDVWGFKRPNAYKALRQIVPILRKPRLIVMFRDILAIAMRNHVSMQMDIIPFLPIYADEYMELVKTVSHIKCPMLLVSYEKFIQFPEESIEKTAAFAGIALTPELRQRALKIINNGTENYLRASRLRYTGHVDRIVDRTLRGWAMVIGQPRVKAKVHLKIDGKLVATLVANKLRKDLVAADIGDGYHGFEIPISGDILQASMVEVIAGNADFQLPNSGKTAAAYGFA